VFDHTPSLRYTDAEIDGRPPPVPPGLIFDAIANGTAVAEGELVMAAHATDDLVVVAGQSALATRDELAGLRVALVLASIVTAVAGAVASWVVSGRALAPVRELAATADDIARTGDLTRRLPPRVTSDEVGALTARFNSMMDRLQGSQDALTRSLARQRRFAADASHELRTPLTTIRSNAGFLAGHPDALPADRDEAVADIVAEADRMAALVDDLLILARTDATPTSEPVEVDLAELVAEVARRAGVQFSGGPARVRGDGAALTRLVWGLVDNARLHGGPPIEVGIRALESEVVVEVADRGPGIPEDQLGAVFERFHRVDPARGPGGSGLGLSIAREIAAAHGGSIVAANRPAGGATLTVRLPSA
jgi:signal transduction histidine kinase